VQYRLLFSSPRLPMKERIHCRLQAGMPSQPPRHCCSPLPAHRSGCRSGLLSAIPSLVTSSLRHQGHVTAFITVINTSCQSPPVGCVWNWGQVSLAQRRRCTPQQDTGVLPRVRVAAQSVTNALCRCQHKNARARSRSEIVREVPGGALSVAEERTARGVFSQRCVLQYAPAFARVAARPRVEMRYMPATANTRSRLYHTACAIQTSSSSHHVMM